MLVIEGGTCRVLRRPSGSGTTAYVVLHQLEAEHENWSTARWESHLAFHLSTLGVRVASGGFASFVQGYACFVAAGRSSGAGTRAAGGLPVFDLIQAMLEMSQLFNMQYLMLQNKISHENRQYSMLSNIMKTKHDTAKNAINNIR